MAEKLIKITVFIFAYIWFRISAFAKWLKLNFQSITIHFAIGFSLYVLYKLILFYNIEPKGSPYILNGFVYGIPLILFGRGVVRFFGYYLLIFQLAVLFASY